MLVDTADLSLGLTVINYLILVCVSVVLVDIARSNKKITQILTENLATVGCLMDRIIEEDERDKESRTQVVHPPYIVKEDVVPSDKEEDEENNAEPSNEREDLEEEPLEDELNEDELNEEELIEELSDDEFDAGTPEEEEDDEPQLKAMNLGLASLGKMLDEMGSDDEESSLTLQEYLEHLNLSCKELIDEAQYLVQRVEDPAERLIAGKIAAQMLLQTQMPVAPIIPDIVSNSEAADSMDKSLPKEDDDIGDWLVSNAYINDMPEDQTELYSGK